MLDSLLLYLVQYVSFAHSYSTDWLELIYIQFFVHMTRMFVQDKETALMLASYHGEKECINVLLERGARVNQQNNVSSTF
tara:strand:+ start:78 stop:317 length:240 start_codon:yes stop_codon:yes gene_type:complete